MAEQKANIGVVGMAVMGKNLALTSKAAVTLLESSTEPAPRLKKL